MIIKWKNAFPGVPHVPSEIPSKILKKKRR
jgi:hypothetical protein